MAANTKVGDEMIERDQWWYSRKKCTQVQGTFNKAAFHVSLQDPLKAPDPLPIPIFSDLLPYHCLPMCGVYGPEDYHMTDPLVLIVLPTGGLLKRDGPFLTLPSDLQQCLSQHLLNCEEDIIFTAIIHSMPSFEYGVDYPLRYLNILYHTWAFRGTDLTRAYF